MSYPGQDRYPVRRGGDPRALPPGPTGPYYGDPYGHGEYDDAYDVDPHGPRSAPPRRSPPISQSRQQYPQPFPGREREYDDRRRRPDRLPPRRQPPDDDRPLRRSRGERNKNLIRRHPQLFGGIALGLIFGISIARPVAYIENQLSSTGGNNSAAAANKPIKLDPNAPLSSDGKVINALNALKNAKDPTTKKPMTVMCPTDFAADKRMLTGKYKVPLAPPSGKPADPDLQICLDVEHAQSVKDAATGGRAEVIFPLVVNPRYPYAKAIGLKETYSAASPAEVKTHTDQMVHFGEMLFAGTDMLDQGTRAQVGVVFDAGAVNDPSKTSPGDTWRKTA
jgi:hypothetical protein